MTDFAVRLSSIAAAPWDDQAPVSAAAAPSRTEEGEDEIVITPAPADIVRRLQVWRLLCRALRLSEEIRCPEHLLGCNTLQEKLTACYRERWHRGQAVWGIPEDAVDP
ncbi:MAG TPA: hypothetical protein VGS41_00345 [Chthonomonadales bacterium]|nr:hypothetical protein [Chthonomonadales bacterium]